MIADSQLFYFKKGTCPCRCGRVVPSGKYWATPQCGRKGNKRGRTMRTRLEKKNRYKK